MKVILILTALSFLSSGCFRENNDLKQNTDAGIKSELTKPHQYNLPELDTAKIAKIIQNRNGRLLFINVWATWCEPCIEEFPVLVKIFNEYKSRNMDFISLSVDQADDDSSVVATIKKFKAGFNVFIAAKKQSEEIINLLNSDWSGEVPATFIYSASGKQSKMILGSRDYAFFKKSIDSVLIK